MPLPEHLRVAKIDLAPVRFVIASIYKHKTRYLSPRETWVENPRDAGLWGEPHALVKIHNHSTWRMLTLDQAIRRFRLELNETSRTKTLVQD